MKKSYLAIAFLMSIFQINQVFSGKDDALVTSENSTCYNKSYQKAHPGGGYYNNQPQSYYDDNQNYVTTYVDGTYFVYYVDTNVSATYYTNGSIQCSYCDGRGATYDALSGLSYYYTDGGFLDIVAPGFPGGIPYFYPNPRYDNCFKKSKIALLKKSNEPFHCGDTKKNVASGIQDQGFNTKPIAQIENDSTLIEIDNLQQPQSDDVKSSKGIAEQILPEIEKISSLKVADDQGVEIFESSQKKTWSSLFKSSSDIKSSKSIDEQILPVIEKISSLKVADDQGVEIVESSQKTTWSSLFKDSSNVVNILPLSDTKKAVSKKRVFNYFDLDRDAKDFLSQYNIQTSSELKNIISKLKNNNGSFTKNEFSCFIDAANIFRHSENIDNKLLSKLILKSVLSHKRVDIYSKKRTYVYLGKIKSHDQQYEKAIKIFQEGLSACGDNARLYYFMGNNYATLERYDEAIQNWEKALIYSEKNDLEIKIKAHARLLYCNEYHQKNHKIIDELYFKVIDLIQNNEVIADYKSLYKKLIMDFADYKTTNNCAAMFVFEKPRTNGSISKNMLNSLSGIYVKHKEAYGKD